MGKGAGAEGRGGAGLAHRGGGRAVGIGASERKRDQRQSVSEPGS